MMMLRQGQPSLIEEWNRTRLRRVLVVLFSIAYL